MRLIDEILINVSPHEVRIALIQEAVLQEIIIERDQKKELLGNIYQGKVARVIPGIQAAFIDIGEERTAYLHVNDVHPSADISQVLTPGQTLLVQVSKEALGSKGARVTTNIAIASHYLVFQPGAKGVKASQKIIDSAEKERLLTLILPHASGGYILRTNAIGVTKTEIDADKAFLNKIWSDIMVATKESNAPQIVYTDIPYVLRILRDVDRFAIKRVRVDDSTVYKQMRDFASVYMPQFYQSIEYFDDPGSIFDLYAVEQELENALQRKVELASGGYIIFDQTEAMTTIDVNTGSFLGHNNVGETIFKTNLEAVDTIARQVRLRNTGGIIIIDFIDMPHTKQKLELLRCVRNAFACDDAKTEVSELSRLGLIQVTRKRTRESLENRVCTPCPTCQTGKVKSTETVCYELFRALKKAISQKPWPGFLILTHQKVNAWLQTEVTTLKKGDKLGRPIELRIDPSFVETYYEILPF